MNAFEMDATAECYRNVHVHGITYTLGRSSHQLFKIKLTSYINALAVELCKASKTSIMLPSHSTQWFREDNVARNDSREKKQRKANI